MDEKDGVKPAVIITLAVVLVAILVINLMWPR